METKDKVQSHGFDIFLAIVIISLMLSNIKPRNQSTMKMKLLIISRP